MTDVLAIVLVVIGQLGLGYAIARPLAGREAQPAQRTGSRLLDAAEVAGLSLVLGIGAMATVQFLWSWLGGTLGRPLSVSVSVGGILAAAVVWLVTRRTYRTMPTADVKQRQPLAVACAVGICVLFLILLVQTLLTPQRFWDERAIYGIKAKVLFTDRTIESQSLHDPDFVQGHPRYPLLVPLAEQHVYALLGRVDDRWSKLVFPMLGLGLVLTFAGVLSRSRPAPQAWLFALLLGLTPVLFFNEYGFLSGQADAPIACYHGVAALYLWHALRAPRGSERGGLRSASIGALAAGLAMFVKDEGIAFFLVDASMFTLCVGVMFANRRADGMGRRIMAAAIVIAGPVLLMAPWLAHRRGLPTTTEMNYAGRFTWETIGAGLTHVPWILRHLYERMFLGAPTHGLHWWGAFAAAATAPGRLRRPAQWFLLGDLLGGLAALVVAGLVAPVAVADHIGGSSDRFLMQLTPVALLLIASQWTSPLDERHRTAFS